MYSFWPKLTLFLIKPFMSGKYPKTEYILFYRIIRLSRFERKVHQAKVLIMLFVKFKEKLPPFGDVGQPTSLKRKIFAILLV